MSVITPKAPADEPAIAHLVVDHRGSLPGPTVVVAAGIHGNEPSGLAALQRVLHRLRQGELPFRGRLVGLAGNLRALQRGDRFIEEDLNRIWSSERVAAIGSPAWIPPTPDAAEQAELLALLEQIFAETEGPGYFLDLHTSSAPGEPFVCIGDTLRNRAFAMQFPVPVILGLEEQVDGALLEYVNNLGHVTMGVEAGQHDHPDSTDHHEAFVWLSLCVAGCLQKECVPDAEATRQGLGRSVGKLPRVMEVRYRHAITPRDGFNMELGYTNFHTVELDELLARDASGAIRAREAGRVLLPLYQGLGGDGFFVVRDVRPLWLSISALLRRLRLDRWVSWLPGVRQGANDDVVIADHHVARWFTVETFHLLGFRKQRTSEGHTSFTRRRESY